MNMNGNQLNHQHLLNAKNLAANRFLRENTFANVVGIGIGKKMVGDRLTNTDCVRIYVQSKLDVEDLRPAALLPPEFLDVPTDVIEIGSLGAGKKLRDPKLGANPRPGFPIRLKSDRPNVSPAAVGTLGAVVKDANDRSNGRYILSCNHVLTWNGRGSELPVVSGVLADPGNNIIAVSDRFVEIRRDEENLVDCALASIKDRDVSSAFPEDIGRLKPEPIQPAVGMTVAKYGAATHYTKGRIVDVDADFFIDYSFGKFRFTNQVVIDSGADHIEFAADGDSGSTGVDLETMQPTAMIFAEAGRFAVACPLAKVLEELEDNLGKKWELVVA
jgi:hypothetical protein